VKKQICPMEEGVCENKTRKKNELGRSLSANLEDRADLVIKTLTLRKASNNIVDLTQ